VINSGLPRRTARDSREKRVPSAIEVAELILDEPKIAAVIHKCESERLQLDVPSLRRQKDASFLLRNSLDNKLGDVELTAL
jgi:hypothetical protein